MPTIDYALAYDFVEPADPTVPYRLEFRYPFTPGEDPRTDVANPAGQLLAVIKGRHPNPEENGGPANTLWWVLAGPGEGVVVRTGVRRGTGRGGMGNHTAT